MFARIKSSISADCGSCASIPFNVLSKYFGVV